MLSLYIYICMHAESIYIYTYIMKCFHHIHIYVYVYMQRDRDPGRTHACIYAEKQRPWVFVSLHIYICLSLCIYTYEYNGRRRSDFRLLRLPRFPTSFHGSPRTHHTISRETPKCQTGFHVRKRSPRHSKEFPGNPEKSGDPNI